MQVEQKMLNDPSLKKIVSRILKLERKRNSKNKSLITRPVFLNHLAKLYIYDIKRALFPPVYLFVWTVFPQIDELIWSKLSWDNEGHQQ